MQPEQDIKKPGRPHGSTNKITAEIREQLAQWMEGEFKNLPALYEKLSAKEKSRFLTGMMPFVVPKQKEIDLSLSALPQHQIEGMLKKILDGNY